MIKLLTVIFFSYSSLACLIQASDFVYSYGTKEKVEIDSTNCSNEEVSKVREIILESEGTLDASRLQRATGIKKIALIPSNIVIKNLERVVHNRLNLSDNIKLEVIEQNIPKQFFNLKNDQYLDITCNNCSKPGIQNLRLSKNNNGKAQTIWIKTKVLQATKAVLSKSKVMLDFSGIKSSNFEQKTIYTTSPNNVVTNIEEIEFYRLNKTISSGHILRTNDLTPIQLVKYGTPAKVLLDNLSLSMSTYATPLTTGILGDTIKLKNIKSNKIIYGKITGKNEVKVEL